MARSVRVSRFRGVVAAMALLAWTTTAQISPATVTETLTDTSTTTTAEMETWTGDADDPYFIGYWIMSEEGTPTPYDTVRYTAWTSWVTSDTYAGECADDEVPCYLPTACTTSGSVVELISANGYSECYDDRVCHTMTIYMSYPEGRPTAYNIACRDADWSMDTVYRVSPTPTSDDTGEDDDDNDNRSWANGRSGVNSSQKTFIILAATLVCALFIAGCIWLPIHRRNKRKAAVRQSEMEISTFAQSRGYTAGNVNAAQPEAPTTESTVADTRYATMGGDDATHHGDNAGPPRDAGNGNTQTGLSK